MPSRFTMPQRRAARPLLGLLALVGLAGADAPDFEREVAPVLRNRCLECHNGQEKAGGLDLATPEGLRQGGEGGPVVTPDDHKASPLLTRTADGEMPPKKQGKARTLPAAEQATLRRWVEAGTPWPAGRRLDLFESTSETRAGRDWWSLQPVRRPEVPAARPGERPANPVDAFVAAGLADKGWSPAPEADRRTLIRRVSFDLVGLPPTYEEVEVFAADGAPDAFERLVDRLLASPHYGERWGRHWLDVARYADTSGYERDQPKPFAWKYRDWVVNAFNADLTFNKFVTDQLAGDESPGHDGASAVATGFLRLGTWNDEPNDAEEYQYERLEDVVHVASTAFLAMTVKCARCHDHKFDPIRQTDYYRVAAAFWPGPIQAGPRDWLGGPDPKLVPGDVLAWTDLGREAAPFRLLKKGDPARPGEVVAPGFPSMVAALDRPLEPPAPDAKTTGRRLQLARWVNDPANPLTARVWVNRVWAHHFGQGLVRSPDNFGFTGDKPTHPELLDWLASEFVAGGGTTKRLHKLLLLSNTYRQASLHPRQAEYERSDAGNRLWWRAERRRLDAESLRDAQLAASGRLDRARVGGPGFMPSVPADALEGLSTREKAWTPSPPAEQRRRALYVYAKRGLLTPLLTVFDFPDTTLPCGQRDVTIVTPQALALLNNPFAHEQSEALAEAARAAAADTDGRLRFAWRRALGRDPSPAELGPARDHLARQATRFAGAAGGKPGAESLALASVCHVLLNANEFLFID